MPFYKQTIEVVILTEKKLPPLGKEVSDMLYHIVKVPFSAGAKVTGNREINLKTMTRLVDKNKEVWVF